MNHDPCVDRELLDEAMRVSGESSASLVLTRALQEYITRRRSPKRILELFGKLEWDAGYDHRGERSRH